MKQIKRKYRNIRAEFKKELLQSMTENKVLAMLVVETYASWQHRRHITQIWGMFKNPEYKAFQQDYCENLMGSHLSGRTDIWRSFYYAGFSNLYDFKYKVPETFAMGDALGVAYKVLKPE